MHGLAHLVHGVAAVAARNSLWMTWNLILAAIPAALAVAVFRHRGPRTVLWWLGAGLGVLFLPNAPYVVTDLVHLQGDVVLAQSNFAVVYGVLPVYGMFIAAGFACYALALGEAGRYLDAHGMARWRPSIEVGVHLVCAVGVVLGRVARLNSWEPVTEPHSAAERILLTLTWRWAPAAVLATFAVTWAGHALTGAAGRWAVTRSAQLWDLGAGLWAAYGPRYGRGAGGH
ncbi:MAG TPA: DUF1361 domain-containing protein [Acidimicrobiales bacterium]|nr:DUF1361 domain-containing protein [Acidimicrobiales bacterium]